MSTATLPTLASEIRAAKMPSYNSSERDPPLGSPWAINRVFRTQLRSALNRQSMQRSDNEAPIPWSELRPRSARGDGLNIVARSECAKQLCRLLASSAGSVVSALTQITLVASYVQPQAHVWCLLLSRQICWQRPEACIACVKHGGGDGGQPVCQPVYQSKRQPQKKR